MFTVHRDVRNSGFVVTVGSKMPRNAGMDHAHVRQGRVVMVQARYEAGLVHLAGLLLILHAGYSILWYNQGTIRP